MITKETYKWVEELLDPKITEISDEDYDQLVKDYFRKDKTDWFELINDKFYVNRISSFWELIRKFCMAEKKEKQYYDFSNFIFPAFQDHGQEGPENFWEDGKNRSFNLIVELGGARFLGKCIFTDVTFENEVSFKYTIFEDDLIIQNCTYKKGVYFFESKIKKMNIINSFFLENFDFKNSNCIGEVNVLNNRFQGILPSFYDSKFHKKVVFSKTTFSSTACRFNESVFLDDVEFFECKFEPKQKIEFLAVTFTKKVDFIRCEFWVDVNFNQSQFLDTTIFDLPIFKEKAYFSYCYFEDVNFKRINTNSLYSGYKNIEPPKLHFRDIFFNSRAFIKNSDLTKLELDNCDVTNITFSRCIWNDNGNRLKLADELPLENLITKEKLIRKIRDSENHYRQLKKNFDNAKNWELSGKAYVSEMEMRKRRLWREGKYYQWFIYKFYNVFGGYTQDFRKPIVSLIELILVFSGLYFFIDYDIVKALQRGIKGALPYMQIDTENPFEGYWLILRNVELVLGGTFLAFFILALRKRFKQ